MHITSLHLKNFRCFTNNSYELDNPVVLISGDNGSGKSSLLEALHYGCYLRSFRTHLPRELINFQANNFFIKIGISHDDAEHAISVGFSENKRLVKIDQQSITSYKELVDYYKLVTITEDDLNLIKGSPEGRRLFLDQALVMHEQRYLHEARAYRKIVEHRNALLLKHKIDQESYTLWTQQLFEKACSIQQFRKKLLANLAQRTTMLIAEWFNNEISIDFTYSAKRIKEEQTFEAFMLENSNLQEQEQRFKRTLFGPHLDDIAISFGNKASRNYASRGQQKLTMVLLKIALLQELSGQGPGIILLDDFMTDFDPQKAEILLELLKKIGGQLIVTSPQKSSHFDKLLLETQKAKHIILTN